MLHFDNRLLRELPLDPETQNFRRQVHKACASRVTPTPVAAPKLLAHSREVADLLGLSPEAVAGPDFAQVFGGNALLPGMEPFAACYGGHQFGNWAGQLGDGRAISLGEAIGAGDKRWELQLKGAGPTPYSRTADGRAVLRSSIREFLCSEAMFHLGVPTTRALSLVTTGDSVVRDMFYSGDPKPEQGAVVCRVAPSFLRFGSFEIFASRRDEETLRTLVEFTLTRDFGHAGPVTKSTIVDWLGEVGRRTAAMVVEWMRVGFVHGVMNTDNMSILGLTIDYGPYGWLDNFDPNWTPNTTDFGNRRYRFGAQPQVAMWNLAQLANALYPLVGEVEPLQEALDEYSTAFERGHTEMTAKKLGLGELRAEDEGLVGSLMALLQQAETDMTLFYRNLAYVPAEDPEVLERLPDDVVVGNVIDAYYAPDDLDEDMVGAIAGWLRHYARRVALDKVSDDERRAAMNAVNPKFVLRNYIAQMVIEAAEKGEGALVSEVLDVMRKPYDEQPERVQYAQKRPEWARDKPGCSTLSCSS